MTDREDLWKAAQILRQRASAASEDACARDLGGVVFTSEPLPDAVAEWIILMSPLLGEHLAEWLEVVANRRHRATTPHSRGILGGSYGYCSCGDPVVAPDNEEVRCDRLRQAINVARIILNANAALEAP